jgi:hypothetical protein
LYISGDGLARGYVNCPDSTAEKFTPNPYSDVPGERFYRTGDKARYRRDGNAEFLGRADQQVKIRGFRIELSEIEAVLCAHPYIGETVLLARESEASDTLLIAYVVRRERSFELSCENEDSGGRRTTAVDSHPSITDLKEFLKLRLPYYMIPAGFVFLDRMPLTPNGKIDRRALPPYERTREELREEYAGPRTELEQQLVAIFSEMLSLNTVGINDGFFALGGHSLLAARTLSLIREKFRVEVPLRVLFESPTVAGLAAAISKFEAKGVQHAEPISRVDPRPVESLIARLGDVPEQELEDLLIVYQERKRRLATKANQ